MEQQTNTQTGMQDSLSALDQPFDQEELAPAPEDQITITPDNDTSYQDDAFSPGLANNQGNKYVQIDRNLINDYLQYNGVKDIDHVMIEDERGQTQYVPFEQLSDEAKINILRGDQQDYDLNSDERDLINTMRANNMTSNDLENYIRDYYYNQYLENTRPQYAVDDFTDDQLYVADLKAKVPTATDDELYQKLQEAKQDTTWYQKETSQLRKSYKEKEDALKQQQYQEQQQQLHNERQQYQNTVANALNNFNSFSELNLDDTDKQELLEMLTQEDANGYTKFDRMMQNPDNLVRAAWMLNNGEYYVNALADYYKQQIREAQGNNKTGPTAVTVKKKPTDSTSLSGNVLSIDQL